MVTRNVKESSLYQQMNVNNFIELDKMFDLKTVKYIQNIDTFYYSIAIVQDEQNKEHYKKVIDILKIHKEIHNDEPVQVYELDPMFYMNGISFGIYEYDLEVLDQCNYFITEKKWNEDTPEIIVQIRSYMLWTYGIKLAFEKSLKYIQDVLDNFRINILEVKENRIDYCWHTNAIQNPKSFFKIDNIANKRCGRLTEYDLHGVFNGDNDYESDYFRLGRRKSNNILFRTYLKSKEVVEMGYKAWFLKVWYLNGLINQYDFYCYEEAFKTGKWSFLNKARLKFYLEYIKDIPDSLRERLLFIIQFETDHDKINELANALTPKVTMIINVEYETKRKFYNSIDKVNFKNRTGYKKEVEIMIDNIPLYINYLTHDTVRFVDPRTATWKKDCDYSNFWKRLRNTKIRESPTLPKDLSIVRKYKDDVDLDNVKQRTIKSFAMYNILKGNMNDNIEQDSLEIISDLNDNDIVNYKRYQKKKIHQIKVDESSLKKSDTNLVTIDLNTNTIVSKSNENFNISKTIQLLKLEKKKQTQLKKDLANRLKNK